MATTTGPEAGDPCAVSIALSRGSQRLPWIDLDPACLDPDMARAWRVAKPAPAMPTPSPKAKPQITWPSLLRNGAYFALFLAGVQLAVVALVLIGPAITPAGLFALWLWGMGGGQGESKPRARRRR